MTIREQLEAARQAVVEAMEKLASEVETLPDNPDIRRLPGGVGFISQSSAPTSAVGWSAETHDFKYQYRKIAETLRGGNPFTALDRLNRIITTRAIGDARDRNKIVFHPKVLEQLKGLLDA